MYASLSFLFEKQTNKQTKKKTQIFISDQSGLLFHGGGPIGW